MTTPDSSKSLLSTVQLGPYRLPNRIVMAPLTRNRAGAGNAPGQLNATYYRQRTSAGLIITEATQISPQGVGYPSTPGIHSAAQVEGWKLVTDTVRQAGGHIFLQLWHVGRISHPSLQPNGQLPVAPSAIAPSQGEAMTYQGMQPFVTPRALELDEIPGIVEDYRQAARNAMAAGFHGVEIHAANGYLLDQFLRDGTNRRTDRYGGPLENRTRLLLEVTQAVTEVWGGDRVGVRLSPGGTFSDMSDSNTLATFDYAVAALNPFDLAYLHIKEADEKDLKYGGEFVPASRYRTHFNGPIVTNCGYNRQTGNEAIASGGVDLVAYGQLFIANPDLPKRFELGAPLNEPDPSSFYGGGAEGYIDYPALETAAA
ncbi:alkene reductase [Synechococcus sp. PCC 7336]|uniref:alkene reductase n=1 Tax=Synechococcus sp. PCC 7336 TaxID=195250 RepID=UPI00034DD8A2|nr:alkene reductase [Synechococcus sp. PCC 7336]